MARRRTAAASCVVVAVLALVAGACKRESAAEPVPRGTASPSPPAGASARSGPSEAAGIRFLERTTGGAEAGERLPLVVAIHGLGDRPESFGALFDGFGGRARIVVPYGTAPHGNGFSWFPLARLDPDKLAEGTERAAHGLAGLIEELERTRPIVGKPIVTGFSQGGMLSFTLAVLHPERVGEALPVSGLLAPRLWPASWPAGKPMPQIHAFHGDADTVVPFQPARDTVEALKKAGLPVEFSTYPGVGHSVSPKMREDVFAALNGAIARAARSR
jgi:phospholipase/carboxylesterase